MPRIGIVLVGGMSKGAYEIGCLNAISKYFPKEDIVRISASSIGTLIAYAYTSGQLDRLTEMWKSLDVKKTGSFFPKFSGNADILEQVRSFVVPPNQLFCKTYGSVWNFTARKVEYMPFHKLDEDAARDYLCASMAIPIFGKGVKINGCTMYDGAFIDNIPVYPMVNKDLDYIFCIYFDGQNYMFESEEFNQKIVKLYRFPNQKRMENFSFDPKSVDGMIELAYNYTCEVIEQLFPGREKEEIYSELRKMESINIATEKKRLTGDVLLYHINKMTKRYAKRVHYE